MTIILPENYHAQSLLEANRITCIRPEEAIRQDIRPMRIGILETTPIDQRDELNFLEPLGLSIIQVDPVWLKLESQTWASLKDNRLWDGYVTYEEATRHKPLDGLIVHGSAVEPKPLEAFADWQEIQEILLDTQASCPSTLGIGWGGLALAHLEGVATAPEPQRRFGVFELKNIFPFHPITGEMDDVFFCPQNRWMGIEGAVLEQAQAEGRFNLLAQSHEGSYIIFETADHRLMMHLGNPEYSLEKMLEEAQSCPPTPPPPAPENFDLANPVSRWRGHRNTLFNYWLKYCYLQVSMTL